MKEATGKKKMILLISRSSYKGIPIFEFPNGLLSVNLGMGEPCTSMQLSEITAFIDSWFETKKN